MSAVNTTERIQLPQETPHEQRIDLPVAGTQEPTVPSGVSLTERAARAFKEILDGKGQTLSLIHI